MYNVNCQWPGGVTPSKNQCPTRWTIRHSIILSTHRIIKSISFIWKKFRKVMMSMQQKLAGVAEEDENFLEDFF